MVAGLAAVAATDSAEVCGTGRICRERQLCDGEEFLSRVYVKKGGNGGRRPGAGRPKGSKSRKDTLLHVKSLREKYPEMPVPFWLTVVNDAEASIERRCRAAFAAAPYVHRRMAREKPVPEACPDCALYDLALLSDEEYELLQQLLIKCSTGQAGSA